MNKYAVLNRIKKMYEEENINIMKYLKNSFDGETNELTDILISYDFQAGSYIETYNNNRELYNDIYGRLVEEIDSVSDSCHSIIECGCGEATALVPILNMVKKSFGFAGGIDISWSRVRCGIDFALRHYSKGKLHLAVGDMFDLPFRDGSVDIVFTKNAIEPNRGKEKEILSELYRIANKWIILVEPAYELASLEARKRMDEFGYITSLYSSARELGYNIKKWELYGKENEELNPTGIMIIKKDGNGDGSGEWACPVTKSKLKKYGNALFSEESMLAYPIVNNVPCLTKDNAIVATKMNCFKFD